MTDRVSDGAHHTSHDQVWMHSAEMHPYWGVSLFSKNAHLCSVWLSRCRCVMHEVSQNMACIRSYAWSKSSVSWMYGACLWMNRENVAAAPVLFTSWSYVCMHHVCVNACICQFLLVFLCSAEWNGKVAWVSLWRESNTETESDTVLRFHPD